MPRYAALGDAFALNNMRAEHGNPRLSSLYPVKMVAAEDVPKETGPRYDTPTPRPGVPSRQGRLVADMRVLHYFEAPDVAAANEYFSRLQQTGCPASLDIVGHAAPSMKPWRFRGDGKYLDARRRSLGCEHIALKHVQCNSHFKEITNLLNQVMDTYRRASRFDGQVRLTPYERSAARETMAKAVRELDHLAVTYAGAADAIDEAYEAMGLDSERAYTKPELKPSSPPPTPAELADARTLAARAESARAEAWRMCDDQAGRIRELSAERDALRATVAEMELRLSVLAEPAPETESNGATAHQKHRPRRGEN